MQPTTNENRRSHHIINVVPRSSYSHDAENLAWQGAIEMARGRPRPTFVVGNRRVLGMTYGRPPGKDPRVLVHKFSPHASFREMLQAKNDMLRMGWLDSNDMISELTLGKFGRTYFAKTPTTAGIANNWYDLWPVGGNPTSGTINGSAFTARQFLDTTVGALNHRGNVSTDTKHVLSKGGIVTANTPWLMLYDRVLAYDACTFNAALNQAMTNTLTAQRYVAAAPGLLPVIVTNTLTGATNANLTQYQYTNQAGTALQSMPTTTAVSFVISAAAPTANLGARVIAPATSAATFTWGFSLPLAAGDSGVRLCANYTTSAANTGSFTNFLMAPLADIMIPVAAVPTEIDAVFQLSELQQIFDGACIGAMAYQPATTGYTLTGTLRFGWG